MTEPTPFGLVVRHPTIAETVGDFSIVHVRSRHEKVFVRELRAESIGYYLPLRQEVRYWHGRRRESWLPVFPGTVFVANGDEGRKLSADSRCVCGFLPVARSYQPRLRDELLILELVLSNQPNAEAFPHLERGRRVEVRKDSGHWAAGLRGVVQRRQKRDVFCVVIEFMGREVPLEDVPGDLLEVIDAAA